MKPSEDNHPDGASKNAIVYHGMNTKSINLYDTQGSMNNLMPSHSEAKLWCFKFWCFHFIDLAIIGCISIHFWDRSWPKLGIQEKIWNSISIAAEMIVSKGTPDLLLVLPSILTGMIQVLRLCHRPLKKIRNWQSQLPKLAINKSSYNIDPWKHGVYKPSISACKCSSIAG